MRRHLQSVLLLPLLLFTLGVKAQYCTPSYVIGCSSGDFINNFSTTGGITNITNNNTGCNGALPSNTTYFSAMNVTQFPGNSFNFSVQSGSWGQGFRIWVDWNANNSFADAGEAVWVSPSSATTPFTGSITVPVGTTPGTKRMRVHCQYATVPAANAFCGTGFFFGETEDYNLIVANPTPCTQIPSGWPPTATTTADKSSICVLDSVTFTFNPSIAIQPASGLSFRWSSGPTATGPWTVIGTSATPTFSTAPPVTGYYKGELMCQSTTVLTNAASVLITVNNPSQPVSTTDGFNCGSGTVSLGATPPAGSTLFWFNAQTGGSMIGTGTTLTTPFITSTTTYYAAAGTSSAKNLQIGTAATSTGGTAYTGGPYSIYYRRSTIQLLYTAAEIIAAGGPMNQINTIKFKCTSVPTYNIPNYTIKMTTVPASVTTLAWQPNASFTTVFNSASHMPTVGWNTYNLTTPFTWNGSDNIVINICWDQVQPTYTASGNHEYTNISGRMLYTWTDAAGSSCGETGTISSTFRPNIILEGLGFCASTRVPVKAYIYNPNAIITNTNIQPICEGDSVQLFAATDTSYSYQWLKNNFIIPGATASSYFAKSSGIYKVIVSQGNGACRDTSDPKTVVVYEMPTPALTYVGPLSFCEGGSIVLRTQTSASNSYQWYRNGVPIGGAVDTFYEASTSGSYSVQLVSPQGCQYFSHTVTITVYPNPTPPIIRNGLVLSTGVYASYQWYRNNAPIPGANNQTYTMTQPGAYLVECVTSDGCINRSQLIIITSLKVNNVVGGNDLKIYPNPTQQKVNISAPFKINVAVQSVTGQVLKNISNAKIIDLTDLPSGAYLFVITNERNELIGKEKVTKVD